MRKLIFLLLLVLLVSGVMAQTLEEKYDSEFNKLKNTRDYVYRNGSTIQWQIVDYNQDFEYYIRIYSYRHISILKEWKIDKPSGEVQFNYPGFLGVHVNLQKWIPEKDQIETCRKLGYPCKIGENLDIITIDPISKTKATDLYIQMVRYWTRSPRDAINGASWKAMINVDKVQG